MPPRFSVKTLQLGQNLESFAAGAFQIGGIIVDNPTGSWLYIPNIREYVQPYTQGWQRPISPTTATITVRFADSPSGSQSTLVGKPVTVTVSDEPVAASNGFPTGSGARQQPFPPSTTTWTVFGAAPVLSAPVYAPVITVPAANRLILRRCAVHPDLTAGQSAPDPNPLCVVQARWSLDIAPFSFSWFQTLTPETPYSSDTFEDGMVVLQPGQTLRVNAYGESNFTMADGGIAGLTAEIQYYLETVNP